MAWTHVALIASFLAGAINFYVAFAHPQGLKRRLRFYSGAFAWFYTAAYWSILWGAPQDRAEWSEALAPFSALVFVTVWVVDAIVDHWRQRDVEDIVGRMQPGEPDER